VKSERAADASLERQLHGMLGSLPLRRASPALLAQVLAELERRVARPWWRRQVMQWPRVARLAFALLAAALALASLAGSARLASLASSPPLGAWQGLRSQPLVLFWHTLAALPAVLLRALPLQWLQVAAVLAAATYGLLIGVGAAAWRLLYLQR
jgi:hypothetical protein